MKKFTRTLGNVLFLLKPWWKYGRLLTIILLFSCIVIFPIRQIAIVTITQSIIEAAQSGRGTAYVVLVALAYMAVIVACYALKESRDELWYSWKQVYVQARIEEQIYEQSIRTDLRYIDDPAYFDSYKMATEKYAERALSILNQTMQSIGAICVGISLIGVMAVSEPISVPIVVIAAVIQTIIRSKLNVIKNEIWKDTTVQRRRMDYLTRLLYTKSANSDIRTTNARTNVFRTFNSAAEERVHINKRHRVRRFFYRLINSTAVDFATYAIMVYVALELVNGRIESIGVFTTLIAASNSLSWNLANITDYMTEFMNDALYAEEIRSFFELKSTIEPSEGGVAPQDGAMSLELCGVSFSYPNSEFALKNINISVKPGEKIAIVGENGAGKTTLSKLLLRLYDIDGGEILYNGTPIKEYDVHQLRRKIGVAFQEPQLYALTVRDNMCVYHSASDEVLRDVLKTVGLDIDLDREVMREFDDNGVMLSGGQAQKLGLSRLLHGEFGLLLLDEPSSALDPLAEYEMTKLIFDCSVTTTIMVAHRLSTIRSADRIYLISDGEVAEQGTHDELIALNGKYAEMFVKQAENYVS
ncbi:MAG: ABC transporter ATP-binding protein/permease [Oscillospiraceae bacterium]|jgi:ATP-binding cassette subfamily B protein|nr:ABC transporter ATP-binding protein/permease [Oscillospiraceae bacterium]